jgi:hypothetical protein
MVILALFNHAPVALSAILNFFVMQGKYLAPNALLIHRLKGLLQDQFRVGVLHRTAADPQDLNHLVSSPPIMIYSGPTIQMMRTSFFGLGLYGVRPCVSRTTLPLYVVAFLFIAGMGQW